MQYIIQNQINNKFINISDDGTVLWVESPTKASVMTSVDINDLIFIENM